MKMVLVIALGSMSLSAQVSGPQPPQAPLYVPQPPQPPLGARQRDRGSAAYERGMRALDGRDWDRAVRSFEQVAKDGSRADGALYWTAYAQNKLGRRGEALAAIAELRKSFPESRWNNDAKALEVEIGQAQGKPVSPESQADEDLKLMAINGLMNSDPERAVPLLEKLLGSTNPPRLKERALFVLSQSGSPRAREVIAAVARGKANPDLQVKAIEYLGLFGGKASRDTLGEIYASSADLSVKRGILRAFMLGGAREQVLAAAKQEKNPELRKEAIRQLGLMGARTELAGMYQAESSADVKKAVLEAMFLCGYVEKIGELAQSEKDPELRREAIHRLGLMGKRAGDSLVAIYNSDSDKTIKKAVLHGLFLQNNAKALIDIARKEADPELKKEAVHRLSLTGSKEATDFMLELLK